MGIIAKEAQLDSSMDLFVDTFIRSRMPATSGTVAQFDLYKRPGQAFKLRRFAPWRLAGTDKSVVIITAGGEVHFPLAAEPALHKLLDGGVISLADFSDMPEDEAVDTLGKLYAFGLLVPAE